MEKFAVIVENDESQWSDQTGVLYHFPKRYQKYLQPGTRVVYYKGKLKSSAFREKRLSDDPHYFGIAVISTVYPDQNSEKGDLYALIDDYQVFDKAVLAKQGDGYLETIPSGRESNYWRDGVRQLLAEDYQWIVSFASWQTPDQQELTTDGDQDDPQSFESGFEGEKKQRFVTTYERDRKLRKQAIAIHGTSCKACGFDFGKTYGDFATGFIHVHHVVPVSEFGGLKKVDPATDLIPLCANCHAIVHLDKFNTLTLEKLRALLAASECP